MLLSSWFSVTNALGSSAKLRLWSIHLYVTAPEGSTFVNKNWGEKDPPAGHPDGWPALTPVNVTYICENTCPPIKVNANANNSFFIIVCFSLSKDSKISN